MAILLILILYFLFYPISIEPVKWDPPKAPELTGEYAQNNELALTEIHFSGECFRCEDVAVDSAGNIYGGQETGQIIKMMKDGSSIEFTNTEGRPLGLDFDAKGNLWIADANKGLLRMDLEGKINVMASDFEGTPFGFTDDLEIGTDGIVYFSDASYKLNIGEYKLDIIEHRPNGSLYSYDPKSKKTELLLDSLYFANGVAVSENADFVLVNETSDYKVTRFWLRGPKAGISETFIENLPGFPDGISRGNDGIFWLTLISPRNKLLDHTANKPLIRKIITRLPEFMKPKPAHYGFVLGLDINGQIVYNLQDPSGSFSQISSVQQFGSRLFFGSLYENGVGIYSLK